MESVNGKLIGTNSLIVDDAQKIIEDYKQKNNKVQSMLTEVNQVYQQLFLRLKKVEAAWQRERSKETLLHQLETSLQQINQRCDDLETQFETSNQQSNLTYQQQIEEINISLNTIKNYLPCLEQKIPKKVMWLTVSSSVAIAVFSFYNWLNIRNLNQQLNPQLMSQILIEFDLDSNITTSQLSHQNQEVI